VFVCENNEYAESTPRRVHQPIPDVAVRAQAYAIPGAVCDGMDFFSVYETAGDAVRRAREGEGPTLVEAKTYRFGGHHMGDPGTAYRTKEEVERHRERDPLVLFKARVQERGLASAQALQAVEGEVSAELENAIRFARQSPPPPIESALQDIFS
jgi:TPP-dependent pyruvate/acetoin dehydrogenase alpha subunit